MKKLSPTFSKGMGVGAVGALLILFGCAHFTFPPYYALDLKNNVIANQKESLPITVCDATADNAYPCIVMKSDDFYSVKAKAEKMAVDLDRCQRGLK